MHEILKRYPIQGFFTYKLQESYKECCNAPSDKSGVYLIYKVDSNNIETLIYIGSSGQRNKDGTIKHRRGGMKDRLINGYHPNRFGEKKRIKRHIAFPQQMRREQIDMIKIYWWVTYEGINVDFPTDIEKLLQAAHIREYRRLPSWHQ